MGLSVADDRGVLLEAVIPPGENKDPTRLCGSITTILTPIPTARSDGMTARMTFPLRTFQLVVAVSALMILL